MVLYGQSKIDRNTWSMVTVGLNSVTYFELCLHRPYCSRPKKTKVQRSGFVSVQIRKVGSVAQCRTVGCPVCSIQVVPCAKFVILELFRLWVCLVCSNLEFTVTELCLDGKRVAVLVLGRSFDGAHVFARPSDCGHKKDKQHIFLFYTSCEFICWGIQDLCIICSGGARTAGTGCTHHEVYAPTPEESSGLCGTRLTIHD